MNVYDMQLHDREEDRDLGILVLRVPGGWIYYERDVDSYSNGTFVPYTNKYEIFPDEDTSSL